MAHDGTASQAVGGVVRSLLEDQGKSMEWLAREVKTSLEGLANAFAGKASLPLEHLISIGFALGHHPDELLRAAIRPGGADY